MGDSEFDRAYERWFRRHVNASVGERRRLLERRVEKEEKYGEDAAEKKFLRNVWWPLYGSLDRIVPEFEVVDFLGTTRFLDHAVIQYPLLADIEVDGYGPHLKNISRWDFANERRRDASLEILGWRVIRFSFDDVKDHPLDCQHLLRHWMERCFPGREEDDPEKRVIALGRYQEVIGLKDVTKVLGVSVPTARKLLRTLVLNHMLVPLGTGAKRVHFYRLNENAVREDDVGKFFVRRF